DQASHGRRGCCSNEHYRCASPAKYQRRFQRYFLRFALADEISNVLTYTRTLDVRPSSITRKYASADVDPQQVGRQLRVAHVLTGHFLKEGDRLRVTLEAVEVVSDRLFWQANISASSQALISLQDQP